MRFFTKIQDQIKNPDNKDFSVRKETMYPKNFDKDDPQYRRYPEERITRLLDSVASLLVFRCILEG